MKLTLFIIGFFLLQSTAISQQLFSDSSLQSAYQVKELCQLGETSLHTVNDFLSSDMGYIWIATPAGLTRFDGGRYVSFNKTTHKAITDNNFSVLAQGPDGYIYVANSNEILRIKGNSVAKIPLQQAFQGMIKAMVVTKSGGILYSDEQNGLFEINNGGSQIHYGTINWLPGLNVTALHKMPNGEIWIGTDKGAATFNNGNIQNFTILSDNHIRDITSDKDGTIWFATHGMGIFKWADNLLAQITTGAGLSSNYVAKITSDGSSIWAATENSGLNRIDDNYIVSFVQSSDMSQRRITTLESDFSGTVWAAFEHMCVNSIIRRSAKTLNTDNYLHSNLIQSVYQSPDETIWVGSITDGLLKVKNDRHVQITTQDGLPDNHILTITGNETGNIWIGTSRGLALYSNTSISVFKEFQDIPIRLAYKDKKGILWVAAENSGLFQFEDGAFVRYPLNDTLDNSTIISMHLDESEKLWIGTKGDGFAYIENGIVEHIAGDTNLSANLVYSFFEDSDNVIWIGTGAGLIRFDDDFEIFTTSLGIQHNEFFSLMEDDYNNLWSTSSLGVQIISKKDIEIFRNGRSPTLQSRALGLSDGLPSRQFISAVFPAGQRLNNGVFLLPTLRGLVHVNPSEFQAPVRVHPVIIEEIVTADSTFSIVENVILEPGTKTLEIHYTSPEFKRPEQVNFRYRLLGFDENWVDAGNRRVAYYSGLNPGNYTFEVQSAIRGENWSNVTGSVSFRITPFFYQSNWFLLLLICGILILGYSTIRLRIKTIREKELTQMVEKRTQELQKEINMHKKTEKQLQASLQEKIVLIKEMHHRVKNNLTLMYALFELQMAKIDNPQINEVLRDSQFRLKSMSMLHEQIYQNEMLSCIRVDEFIKQLLANMSDSVLKSNQKITSEHDLVPVELDVNQSVPFALILNELVTNIYKHAFIGKDEGSFKIVLEFNDPQVTLHISDNGVGLSKPFSSLETESLGHELVSTLVSQLNGTIDCTVDNGTKFVIKFDKVDE